MLCRYQSRTCMKSSFIDGATAITDSKDDFWSLSRILAAALISVWVFILFVFIVYFVCLFVLDGAGSNIQHGTTKNTAKLDRETEELHHDRVSLSVARAIQQGRQAKGITQKDLATVRYSCNLIECWSWLRVASCQSCLWDMRRAVIP